MLETSGPMAWSEVIKNQISQEDSQRIFVYTADSYESEHVINMRDQLWMIPGQDKEFEQDEDFDGGGSSGGSALKRNPGFMIGSSDLPIEMFQIPPLPQSSVNSREEINPNSDISRAASGDHEAFTESHVSRLDTAVIINDVFMGATAQVGVQFSESVGFHNENGGRASKKARTAP